MTTSTYPPPVDQLLTLGQPSFGYSWDDYLALGLSEDHVPALIEMMQDERLSWEAYDEGTDETPFWAPVHARRALGQLCAEVAVEPLLRHLLTQVDDDWAIEDIPRALGMIGSAALQPIRTALPTAARENDPWPAVRLATSLQEIGVRHPVVRDQAVEALLRQLRLWDNQAGELNGFLVSDLVELRAIEAAPVMQEAYEAGAVDISIVGDWEDVQLELGLLSERITPRPHYHPELALRIRHQARSIPVPGSTSAASKARQLRKAQKQAAKKKRRR